MEKPVYQHLSTRTFEAGIEYYEAASAPLEFCLHGEALDGWRQNDTRRMIERLKDGPIPAFSLHGPIFGFDPASHDVALRDIARRRVLTCLEIAEILDPEVLVLHSSYNPYFHRFSADYWSEATARFYEAMLKELPGERLRLVLENIYDITPKPLAKVIDELNHPRLGFCFDIGHFNMFKNDADFSMSDYLQHFDGRLFHMHLHDNHGREDLHLPPGSCSIDYRPFLDFVQRQKQCWSVTVEGKTPDDNRQAVQWVREHLELG